MWDAQTLPEQRWYCVILILYLRIARSMLQLGSSQHTMIVFIITLQETKMEITILTPRNYQLHYSIR